MKLYRNEVDITGQRFGKLVTVGKSSRKGKEQKNYLWEFKCDCGTDYFGQKHPVINGQVVSCGCHKRDLAALSAEDMVGRKIGTFIVVRRLPPTGSQGTLWRCQCDCGHTFEARGRLLRNGQVRHCPACRKNRTRLSAEKELAGAKFGHLYVLDLASTCPRRGRIMLCICECGNRTQVPLKYLRSGNTKSCGCLKAKKLGGLMSKITNRNRRRAAPN